MVSESKVLYSTLENILRNELSYADTIVVSDGTVLFTSSNYSSSQYNADGGEYAKCWHVGAEGGHIVLLRDMSPSQPLITDSAYTYDMTASVQVTASPDNSYIHVVLSIYDKNGNPLIENEPFDVRPLNTTIMSMSP